ncbi:helix-turn-helix transcriptional regulator [Roseovarius sp. EL26]|uniref:helix-turn-helix domain-containing protein n=1 Tax=Roseovarius sp. EL26 TaxID=2126672 RepID=UPI000EA0AE1D|nr:helix-turn-helix transcriptional regulator [Roseovarius sp. EL26]
MSNDNLKANLRLLFSYGTSITKTSDILGINRQQIHRYLNGENRPSMRVMREICDYFGVEESELLLDHASFKSLISLRKPRVAEMDPFGEYIAKIHRINPDAYENMKPYLGYYRSYFLPADFPGKILCSLVKLHSKHGFVYLKNVENYSSATRRSRRTLKFTGVVFHTGERIMAHEREVKAGQMMWTTVLHPPNTDQTNLLTGLTMGVSSSAIRDIACYRVVWEPLPAPVNLRNALGSCGLFDVTDECIPSDIREAIRNDVRDDESAFVGRAWQHQ